MGSGGSILGGGEWWWDFLGCGSGGFILGGGEWWWIFFGWWWVMVDGGMVYISPSHIALHCYN